MLTKGADMLGRVRGSAFSMITILGCALAAAFASAALAFDVKRADQSVMRVVLWEIKDGKRTGTYGFGTGFVVDREYVVTNNHVIDDSSFKAKGNTSELTVVDGSAKSIRAGQLIWASPELDLAVVKVPGLTRPTLTLAGAPSAGYPSKGEIVWAIGFPGLADRWLKSEEGLLSSTVTRGVVSKVVLGKQANGDDKTRPVVQHDASINKGNSGGPLFDNCGLVVGVNTFAAYTIMQVDKDKEQGKDIAHGMPNTGIFFAPHITNLIEARATVPALKPMNLSVSTTECPNAMGETGVPGWVYGAIGLVALLALGATVLALRRGTTREVVRMVESYSAYVKRRGRPPSEESMQPRRVSNPPDISMPGASAPGASVPSAAAAKSTAAPTAGWKLSGKGSKGQAISIAISLDDMDRAMAKKEAGIVLGRSGSLADVTIEDETVSRRHAKIYTTERGLALEDLKSAYGTQVNGHKLEAFQAVEIKAGDKLALGGVELTVAVAR